MVFHIALRRRLKLYQVGLVSSSLIYYSVGVEWLIAPSFQFNIFFYSISVLMTKSCLKTHFPPFFCANLSDNIL